MTEPIEDFPQELLDDLLKFTARERVLETVQEIERRYGLDRAGAVQVIQTALRSHEALFLAGLQPPTNSVN